MLASFFLGIFVVALLGLAIPAPSNHIYMPYNDPSKVAPPATTADRDTRLGWVLKFERKKKSKI